MYKRAYVAGVLMLHLSNQQLYARENHIPKPSAPIEAYRCPISYLGFGFSIFSPRSPVSPPRVPYPSSPRDFSRSSAHLRSQALVRPQRNGRSVAFWTKACLREGRRERFASRLGSVSRHLHSTLLFLDCPIQVFGLGSISLSMQSPLPALRPNVPLRSFRDRSYHSEPVN